MTKNDIIVHYNKFPNSGVFGANFPNLKGPRTPSQNCKKIPVRIYYLSLAMQIGLKVHFIYTLPASDSFCCFFMSFANSLDPDQARQTVRHSDGILEFFRCE